jgi:hypothetical protein
MRVRRTKGHIWFGARPFVGAQSINGRSSGPNASEETPILGQWLRLSAYGRCWANATTMLAGPPAHPARLDRLAGDRRLILTRPLLV